ncbi:MAG: MFS transporter [Leadbetterella sp.]|nr:MFS transporter [Leadbetterella sp.]
MRQLFLVFFQALICSIPELPDYLTKMGGGEFKGLIIALFTLTAGLSRPFSGKLSDTIGRVPVMAFGSLVCFVCGFLYPVTTTVMPFLLLRLVHGFSTGFKPTGTAAYIADIVPFNRRGESMGIHGLIGSLGMAFGPFLGGWIVQHFDFNILFYTSSVLSFLSIAILINMKETLPAERKEPFRWALLKINRHEIFDGSVMPVVVVVFFCMFSYGAVITLIPDLSKSIGLKNKGFYFLVYTLASIGIRFIAGRWSDRNGRPNVLIIGCLFIIVSLGCLVFTRGLPLLTLSAVLFGIGNGIVSPITQAWTIDLCAEENRGKAVATMYIALEAGIGLGALLPTFIYQNRVGNLPASFIFTAAVVTVALIYLLIYNRKHSVSILQE